LVGGRASNGFPSFGFFSSPSSSEAFSFAAAFSFGFSSTFGGAYGLMILAQNLTLPSL